MTKIYSLPLSLGLSQTVKLELSPNEFTPSDDSFGLFAYEPKEFNFLTVEKLDIVSSLLKYPEDDD